MNTAFVKVIKAPPDLPAQGPEPYIRINTFAAGGLGIPENLLFSPGESDIKLRVGGQTFHATWELYTAEPDSGPILRLTKQGLALTGLKAGRTYIAHYSPSAKLVTIQRTVSGK